MDQKQFQGLLRYYLSCIDAEEAMQLKLRKDQEFKTYIWAGTEEEQLFSQDLPSLEVLASEQGQIRFIEQKAPSSETLVDLYYGYPVFQDEKDMLSPLFFVEAEANFSRDTTLALLPKVKKLSVNRIHFLKRYDAEEMQRICEELEGEFGSFEARIKAAQEYIPSLSQNDTNWLMKPILFRSSNNNGLKRSLRYDLTFILKDKEALTKDTALKHFIQGADRSHQGQSNTLPILEIGGLNPQQEEAVTKGLQEPLSVVTGPPGTGKTQVVTALLASAIYNNQTVLFASNNNMPVDGVYERLGQYTGRTGNWIMRLGNQEKRGECFQIIAGLLERVDTLPFAKENQAQEMERFSKLEREILQTRALLHKAASLEETISQLQLKENEVLQKLPDVWVEQFIDSDPKVLDEVLVKKLKAHSARGLWLWIRRKIFSVEKFRDKQNALLSALLQPYDQLVISEDLRLFDEDWNKALEKARKSVNHVLRHQHWIKILNRKSQFETQLLRYPTIIDLANLKQDKTLVSQTLFSQKWLSGMQNVAQQAREALNIYSKDIEYRGQGRHSILEKSLSALKRFFPIWITTNLSAGGIMPPTPSLFDLVVIDEAGQCDIPSVIPLLYRAKHAVIIGDSQQFRHITTLDPSLEEVIAKRANVTNMLDEWSYTGRSAFDRSFAATPSSSLLKQHYRCHPDIIEFSNQNFYGGKLVAQTSSSQSSKHLPIEQSGLLWHNVSGQAIRAQKGAWNPVEVAQTVSIFEQWAQQGLFSDQSLTYGVITPFRKQVEEMQKALKQTHWFKSVEDRFTIGTAHSFQGSECDILVYSPVVAKEMDPRLIKFAATQKELINVTVTRAKNLLYIVGDLYACQAVPSDTPLYQLASYAEQIRKNQKQPMNAVEKAIANILDELNLSYVAQHPIGPYRLDFMVNASSGQQYDVEVDGDIHLTAQNVQHDERRDAYVISQGLKIIRFAARDISKKPEAIKARLLRI